jgi:hypothetical protein
MQYTEKTIKTERYTVTIRRPILSDSERTKREREVVQALERFGKAIEKEKRK